MTEENEIKNEEVSKNDETTTAEVKKGELPHYERSYKNILVNKEVQITLWGYFILLIAVLFCCSIGIVYYFWHRYSEAWVSLGMIESTTFGNFLFSKNMIVVVYSLVFGIVIMGFFVFDWVRFSHKIVGPIYHLESHINSMVEDENFELKEVTFRETDKFQTLAASFNSLIKKLKDKN